MLVFPQMMVHLDVGREKSVAAIEAAMQLDKKVLLLAQMNSDIAEPQEADMARVGTIGCIQQVLRMPGGTTRILVEGQGRAEVHRFYEEPFYRADVVFRPEERLITSEVETMIYALCGKFEELGRINKRIKPETVGKVVGVKEPGKMADLIASNLSLKLEDKQKVLAAIDIRERLEWVTELVLREMEITEMDRRIGMRVRKQMERTQKEFYLREQIKAIQKELGEKDERQSDIEEYRTKLSELSLDGEAGEKAQKELERLEKMPPASAEATVVRTYLDWIIALPWHSSTKDRSDFRKCEKILNEDHYGLEKVKERIIEFLALRRLTDKPRSPLLCLVGPPGVGKTSMAQSVARALGREFVRMSLGGLRDEAEIRGHRRTYIGALPGRIIQGIRRAGSGNPVFLLDEIDKMTADFRGDPASALLEILDPEQNSTFADHYLEIPFDLSEVLFVTTANTTDTIPKPLLDRMELITISGYTDIEKQHIARNHLLPKQLKLHGLPAKRLAFSEEALSSLIRNYTRESGVRNLEREIANVLRKICVKIVRREWSRQGLQELKAVDIMEYLGAPRYLHTTKAAEPKTGVAAGLAYTQVGGEILFIEVTTLSGKGELTLTGKLGDVMKESAQAGWTYVRAHATELGIDGDFYKTTDIHIHVPEGATPKDGPSAGITMITAMTSALSGRAVRQDLAMTGEVNLRGEVMPIGGVKEKVLAAYRAGMKTVILPLANRKDYEEIPQEVRDTVEFCWVDRVETVLAEALLPLLPHPAILDKMGEYVAHAALSPN
jgi:ATP-dependent Lon protease